MYEIFNYDVGLTQKISSFASSAGSVSAGRADFEDFCFQKQLDKASPKLALACANGSHIDTVVIEICRAGGDRVKFMEYNLSNCIISKISTATGGAFPYEDVSINYGKITWVYTQQKRSGGSAAGQIASGWDLQKNLRL